MQIPTIPQAAAALLPFLATILSRWLADDRLKAGENAAIAAFFLLATAIVCAWLAGNFTGNAQASVLVVLSYVTYLMRGDLVTLLLFFDLAPSPMANARFGPPPSPSRPAPTVIMTPDAPPPASANGMSPHPPSV